MCGSVTWIDEDIFTVDGIFSPTECGNLIERAESIGFQPASVRTRSGPKMLPDVRNNDRVNLTDHELADLLWERIRHSLPEIEGERAIGVDPRLRFYRYEPGQHFRRHRDGIATSESGQRSRLSYLVYLNGGFTGGETRFLNDRVDDQLGDEVLQVVSPCEGMALLFRHRRVHEGVPLTEGTKYVLRTDVFYGEDVPGSTRGVQSS